MESCVLFCFLSCLYSKSDMSRLRLAAGSAIMKLAQEPCYHEIITPEQFQLCALVINVSNCIWIEVTLNWVQSPYIWAFIAATLRIFCSSLQLSKETWKFLETSGIYCAAPVNIFKMSPHNSTLNAFFFFPQDQDFNGCIHVLCCYRMSATKWGRYLPRNCIRHLWNYCSLWNIWQSLLCVPKTLWKREEHMPDSACSKTSVYEENILSRILWLTVSISVKLLRIQQSNTKLEGVIIKT